MDRSNQGNLNRMARGSLLRVDNRAGTLVRVRAGEVWVTENGGGDDHVLRAGQSLRLRRRGLAIVQALEHSVVSVAAPERVSFARRLFDALLAPLLTSADVNGKGRNHA